MSPPRCFLPVMVALCLSTAVMAHEQVPSARTTIPFKSEPSPIESHGENLGIAMLLLLAGAAGVLYYVRRRLPQAAIGFKLGVGKRIQIVEQTRMNARCTLYLVRFDQREVLVSQCGDNVTMLDSVPVVSEKTESTSV